MLEHGFFLMQYFSLRYEYLISNKFFFYVFIMISSDPDKMSKVFFFFFFFLNAGK